MPAPDPGLLGPLAALIGTWEGDEGLDVSFHNADHAIGDTPYRERVTMNPFGPVDNGKQCLYGLDYRMAAWRSGDRGETWARIRGFNFKWGHRVNPDANDPSKIYVTTFGGSLWI